MERKCYLSFLAKKDCMPYLALVKVIDYLD